MLITCTTYNGVLTHLKPHHTTSEARGGVVSAPLKIRIALFQGSKGRCGGYGTKLVLGKADGPGGSLPLQNSGPREGMTLQQAQKVKTPQNHSAAQFATCSRLCALHSKENKALQIVLPYVDVYMCM
jgi:hypothetical protein